MNLQELFYNKSVLTIDDSATIRAFLRSLLTAQGAHVDEARTGAEGLALFEDGKNYQLVLLDLLLPDMDGIEVLEQMRQLDDHCTIVMLTGMGNVRSATAAVRQGADGYLQKQEISFNGDPSDFFYAVEQAMAHRSGLVARKQLEEMKADFYSMVTHDLRNPASALLLISQLLLEQEDGPLNDHQLELVELMNQSASKLLNHINNYLDYAKIDAGYLQLEYAHTSMEEVVRSVARPAIIQAAVKQQTLSLDLPGDPVEGMVDGERLKQIIDNLLSNAIKYTPEGGSIRLSLRRTEEEWAQIEVSDSGSGIPPDALPALFTKYHRVPGESARTVKGTGLGLLIVKEIIEAHGGTVNVQSDGIPGHGTTFTITLPLTIRPRGAEQ